MLRKIKIGWHKAQALSAVQTYLSVPLKEPLPPVLNEQLLRLANRGVDEGVTPIDTAFRFYAQLLAEHISNNGSLDSIGFFGALGRLSALRDKMKIYHEHHESMIANSKFEEANKK